MFLKALLTIFTVFIVLGSRAQAPTLILTNGKIFTAQDSKTFVEALAIRGDRIIAAGSNAQIQKLAVPQTKHINLSGRTVIPGINDAHDHVGYGVPMSRFINFDVEMLPGPTLDQLLDSLAVAVKQVPAGTMIQAKLGLQLIQAKLGLQLIQDKRARRKVLDSIAPNHPVFINAPWGHGTILNTKALQLLGIESNAPDPVGGFYERVEGTNEISGLMAEYAEFALLRQWHATLPQKELQKTFAAYCNDALKMGITTVQNMATSLDLSRTVAVLKAVNSPLRVRVIRFPGTSDKGRELQAWTGNFLPTPTLYVSGMKWILDGTPLERGALMRTAYSDRAGWPGRLNMPADTIRNIVQDAVRSGEQLMLHIVGDSTPAIVLKAMKASASPSLWKVKRPRFEHADGLLEEYYADVKNLGIVPVINPSHFMFSDINTARVGKERSAHYQPFRSLIEAGIPVAIGSDGPNNPFLNIMFATMHPTNPSEAVTVPQAVYAYTAGSAFAEKKESVKGKLLPGMLADLAVLSQDIFTVPAQALPGTASLLTIIGGKVVYDAGVVK